jgi:transcription antitermination protein NusB
MISRRIIRVKVMQTLYSMETQETLVSPSESLKLLERHLDQTRQTLVFFTHFLTEVARYAETDARNRASKYIPSAKDLHVNTKISGNEILWKIIEHPSYVQALKHDKPHLINEEDLTRKIYTDLTSSDKYRHYISVQARDRKEEKDIMEYIFTDMMLPNENFTAFVEERFPNWDDDADMIQQLMLGIISKPAALNLQELIGPEKMTFAQDLLRTAIEKKEVTMEYIRPKLKNWEPERIATLDMILMRMGVCEFLFFETIPPKVTINEYIDLAKEYSTQQSGQFINGILDNIHKDLLRDDKMHKVSFKQP